MLNALLVGAAIFVPQGEVDQPIAPGTSLDFRVESLEGKPVNSSSFKGKPLLVALWGTWSPPSSRALEIAQALHEDFGQKGLKVVSIACWDNKNNVLGFKRANANLTFEFLIDPAGSDTESSVAVQVFKTRRFPTFYVIEKQGKVVQGFLGARAVNKPDIAAAIQKAL